MYFHEWIKGDYLVSLSSKFHGIKFKLLIAIAIMLFILSVSGLIPKLGIRMTVIFIVMVLLLLITNFLLNKMILEPLMVFIRFANKSSDKDLSLKIELKTHDEFEQLGNSLNQMVQNIQSILDENLQSSEQLAVAASEMTSLTGKVDAATQEITKTMEQMSKVTEEQYENVHLSVVASQQMAETAQLVATEAQKAANLSTQVSQRARNGEEIIQEINSKITQLKETVDNSAEVVRKLGKSSVEIGKIVDVIRSISRQTNLLALNAAIEAARAGEHGRGFSVVADEVRALAEQSTNSAIQIVALVNEIRSETMTAVDAMELGTQSVDEGSKLVLSARQTFNDITQSVNQTVNTIHEIAAASEEQAASSQEMTGTMETVAAISKQNVSSANQVASASKEQRIDMENLSMSAAQLEQMADNLTSMVGRFKVKTDFQRCWRVMDCNYVGCPAYQSKEEKCWIIPETLCQDGVPNGSVVNKAAMCHQCEVFRINNKK
jgi:methyl-accepting chemotaxis protein